jgi:hypothetical protein
MFDNDDYNPILPSSLLAFDHDGVTDAYKNSKSNFSLKTGIVIKSYDTNDPQNVSGVAVEYDVLTIDQSKDHGTSGVIYKKCLSVDGFGGLSDFMEAKLRPASDKKVIKDAEIGNSDGAIVMLLCINGIEDRGVIIGSLKHPGRKTRLDKEAGLHLEGEYNGLNWKIDKDGALAVTFRSATDSKGKASDEKSGGSNFKIEKDGSIELNDNNKEKIRIDKTNKTVTINAEKDISNTTEGNFNVTAKQSTNVTTTKDILMAASGNCKLTSQGDFTVEAQASGNLKASSWNIKADDFIEARAGSIRLSSSQVMVGQGGTPAVINSTQVLTFVPPGIPSIGIMIGPFSGSVFIAN